MLRQCGAGQHGGTAAQVHHKACVQRAALQLGRDFVVGKGRNFQRDARVPLPEGFQGVAQRGQVVRHQRHADAQPQRRGLNVLIGLRTHAVKLFHHRRGLRPEALAFCGEGKAVAAVREQRAAQFFFQRGDAQPQSLPGQIKLPGGVGIEWPEGQDVAPHELYENSILVKKTA